MVKIIDKSTADVHTGQFRVPPTEEAGLTFVHVDFLDDPAEEIRVDYLLDKYGAPIPSELTCNIEPRDGNTGFTFEQSAESDIPGMVYAIYENGEMIGGLSVLRIKIISSSPSI